MRFENSYQVGGFFYFIVRHFALRIVCDTPIGTQKVTPFPGPTKSATKNGKKNSSGTPNTCASRQPPLRSPFQNPSQPLPSCPNSRKWCPRSSARRNGAPKRKRRGRAAEKRKLSPSDKKNNYWCLVRFLNRDFYTDNGHFWTFSSNRSRNYKNW